MEINSWFITIRAKDRPIGLAARGSKEAPHLPEREKARPFVHDGPGKPSLTRNFL
jgi:hypothetical protein